MQDDEPKKIPIPSKKKLQEFCENNLLMSAQFLSQTTTGTIFYYILFFLPIPFLIYLLDRWLDQKIKLFLCYNKVNFLNEADTIVILDQGENISIESFSRQEIYLGKELPKMSCLTFVFLNVRYIFDEPSENFESINEVFCKASVAETHKNFRFGRYISEIPELLETYGENKIEVTKPNIIEMLVNDMLSFMGAFEVSCLALVIIDNNTIYLIFFICLTIFSKTMMVLDGFHQYERIQRYLMLADGVIVIRKNADDCFVKTTISNRYTVPGDIIELTTNLKITTDAVIVSGSCMVDEKDISGDSIPRVKFAIDDNSTKILSNLPENYLARSGGTCLFTRTEINDSVLAIVIKTGYTTEKGKLMRSVLMPKIIKFRFFNEALVFVYIMACISGIGSIIYLIYKIYYLTEIDFTFKKYMLNVFGLFFSAIKPVLPFTLYLGLEASKDRLEAMKIGCSNKYKINECGRTDTIFFDKTGTLTKDFSIFNGMYIAVGKSDGTKPDLSKMLELSAIKAAEVKEDKSPEDEQKVQAQLQASKISGRQGPRPGGKVEEEFTSQIFKAKIKEGNFFAALKNVLQIDGILFSNRINTQEELFELGLDARKYLFCLSFCNNLIISGKKVVGDNIDNEIFRLAPYFLQNYIIPGARIIKKRYVLRPDIKIPFSMPETMTVERTFDYNFEFEYEAILLSNDKGKFYLVAKGAPEEIALLCKPSTMPRTFNSTLYDICATGARVLGMAMIELGEDTTAITKPREELARDLTFCGLFALDNPLKDEAAEIISTLTSNLIRCILITGDNIFTAVSIAARSTILPPGKTLFLGEFVESNEEANVKWALFDYTQLLPQKKVNPDEESLVQEDNSEEEEQSKKKEMAIEIKTIDDLINIDTSKYVLAISGNAYDFFIEKYQKKMTKKGKALFEILHKICLIYGRCDAYQKSRIVRNHGLFRTTKYPIGYVGDGANDTEAMKQADISLLISQADISFAAPFSSNDGDLFKVIELIKEGKNNVESGYQNFNFFIFLIVSQFVATFLLYLHYIDFNIYQRMFMDIAVFMILCGMSDTFWHKKRLNRYKPRSSIVVFDVLFKLFCHLTVAGLFLIYAFQQLVTYSFYKPPQLIFSDTDKQNMNIDLEAYKFYDNHYLFCLMNLFFVSYFIFSNFKNRFRVPLFKNVKVALYLVFFFAFMIYLCNLSEATEPNIVDNVFIDFFGILKTYRTNRIFIKMTVAYWLCAFFIEKLSDTVTSYRENMKFNIQEQNFIQAQPKKAAKKDEKSEVIDDDD